MQSPTTPTTLTVQHLKSAGYAGAGARYVPQAAQIQADELAAFVQCRIENDKRAVSLFAELADEGYRPGAGNDLDAQVCAAAKCKCGAVGAEYQAFRKGQSYRAVARCTTCGSTYEF